MTQASYRVGPMVVVIGLLCLAPGTSASELTLVPGHPSLQSWLLPERPPYPEGNEPTPARVALGKKLFFDPRLSGDGNMSCATCHNPMFGWSDGLPTAKGFRSKVLARATPSVTNTAYNALQMWDGRKASLEDQAMGPMEASVEMNTDIGKLLEWLKSTTQYSTLFSQAYPGEEIAAATVSKAIASFERTLVSNDSPFDRWVAGEVAAMTDQQVRGFEIFVDENKGNCAACHSAPNFTDDGFHNVGLLSWGDENPDMGRYTEKPVGLMKGAFKTPTLRDIALTAPYFHDGSAADLMDVLDHYVSGGRVTTNLSPNMKALRLNQQEKRGSGRFSPCTDPTPRGAGVAGVAKCRAGLGGYRARHQQNIVRQQLTRLSIVRYPS